MKDQEKEAFSWVSFLFVTSFSFFLFSWALKMLNGMHSKVFIFAGIGISVLGAVCWLVTRFTTTSEHKPKKRNKQYS